MCIVRIFRVSLEYESIIRIRKIVRVSLEYEVCIVRINLPLYVECYVWCLELL